MERHRRAGRPGIGFKPRGDGSFLSLSFLGFFWDFLDSFLSLSFLRRGAIGGTMARRKKKPTVSPGETGRRQYTERNRVLKAMGFESYAVYLRSDLWLGIRSKVLIAQPDCFVCGKLASQVHHTAYRKKDLEGRDLRRLVALCRHCHRRIEFRDGDGKKLNVTQARAKMRLMRTLREKAESSPARPASVDGVRLRMHEGGR
jgi:hypothetical protein